MLRTYQHPGILKRLAICRVCDNHGIEYIYIYIYLFQNVFIRCQTPRLYCFLSSHWHSFRFLSFLAFLIPSIQFFFGLPHALFCFGIHFNAILGNLPSAILWTRPYHVSWFCSISFIIVSSSPICCLIVTFLILYFLYIFEDLFRTSISVDSTHRRKNFSEKSRRKRLRFEDLYIQGQDNIKNKFKYLDLKGAYWFNLAQGMD